ncbi:NACHT domain protein [Crocosphaera sp.]|uniref:NACHT domain protein n=1 Tax=Crocosphaera sp. TaxID=2729996 RepID=UPI002630699C|nr:NACHT domain protein [Crocosphaera sp.]MDJ0581421.1 NACHT domain protein [Crocosphaera sp.]
MEMEIKFDFLGTTDTILNLITKVAEVSKLTLDEAQKNKRINEILQNLNLNPIETADNVEIVYAYALVEYGVFKPQPILELLRNRKIKDDFWGAYTNNTPLLFLEKVKEVLNQNTKLKTAIQNSRIELAVELEEFGETFIAYAKRTTADKFKVNDNYPTWDLGLIPNEFEATVEEKTKLFCGRKFVFDEFEKFTQEKSKGYFTVIGDAGMGKSAISSKYVKMKKVPCFFNIFAEGRNTPEQFLNSIRKQLINRYKLQNQENTDLRTLIQKASEKLSEGKKLIILVDALDEVEDAKEGTGNLLDLPQTLPNNVYFFLTRRPFKPEHKRLTVSPETPYDELDLRQKKYQKSNKDDIEEYINLFINYDKEYKDELRNWLKERKINDFTFVDTVTKKSENNFMYLRYVLPAIAKGQYNDLELNDFPVGLEGYYNSHWERMDMQHKRKEIEVFVLFVLLQNKIAPTLKIITETVQKAEGFEDIEDLDVEKVLDPWEEYLKIEKEQGEKRYRIYHASFADFLRHKSELNENRKIFANVIDSKVEATYQNKAIRSIYQKNRQ